MHAHAHARPDAWLDAAEWTIAAARDKKMLRLSDAQCRVLAHRMGFQEDEKDLWLAVDAKPVKG